MAQLFFSRVCNELGKLWFGGRGGWWWGGGGCAWFGSGVCDSVGWIPVPPSSGGFLKERV